MKRLFSVFAMIFALCVLAQAQTTAFNFQGRLNDGSNPANGRYDLQFKLYDAIAGGTQVGAVLSKPNLMLVNGVFSTTLDFGVAAFNGGDRFLEISLRLTGTANVAPNAFVILGARQQILSVPYAAKSFNASNADNATNSQNAVNAQNANNATNAQTAVNSQQLGSLPASRYLAADTNGNITLSGNVYQPANSVGLPKAFVRLNRDGIITNCFNGITGQSANNCGFGTSHTALGTYGINFGFDVSNRIILVTSEVDDGSTAASLSRSNSSQIGVFVKYIFDSFAGDATNAPINVVVY